MGYDVTPRSLLVVKPSATSSGPPSTANPCSLSSNDNETISWDVATGARKDKVAGQLAFTKTEIGRYIVTHQDDLIFVYDTRGVVVNADGKEKVPIAFFRAPSPVVSVCCAGDKVAVGCQSGAVLTLHAAWLTDGGAA